MFWQYSKIVVLNTSFFEKIMEICIINAAYLSQLCLILASYMKQVWLWRRLNDTGLASLQMQKSHFKGTVRTKKEQKGPVRTSKKNLQKQISFIHAQVPSSKPATPHVDYHTKARPWPMCRRWSPWSSRSSPSLCCCSSCWTLPRCGSPGPSLCREQERLHSPFLTA